MEMFPKISQILSESRSILKGLWRKTAWNEFLVTLVKGKFTVAMALCEFIYLIIFIIKAIIPKFDISTTYAWMGIAIIGGHILITLIRNSIGCGMQIGLNRYYLEMVNNPKAQPTLSFRSHMSSFGNQLTMNLSRDMGVYLLSLLFVVPGLMAQLKWSMADYSIAKEPTTKGQEAITDSGYSMEGKKWKYFALQAILFLIYIPIIMVASLAVRIALITDTTLIGIALMIIPLIAFFFAEAYRNTCKARFFYYIENPLIDRNEVNKLKTLEAERFNFEDFMLEYEEKVAQKQKQNRK